MKPSGRSAAIAEIRGYIAWLWVQSDVAEARLEVDGEPVGTLPLGAPVPV